MFLFIFTLLYLMFCSVENNNFQCKDKRNMRLIRQRYTFTAALRQAYFIEWYLIFQKIKCLDWPHISIYRSKFYKVTYA